MAHLLRTGPVQHFGIPSVCKVLLFQDGHYLTIESLYVEEVVARVGKVDILSDSDDESS